MKTREVSHQFPLNGVNVVVSEQLLASQEHSE
jgi:hypothetical protein